MTRREKLHHLLAHPLLVLWPRVGEFLHELTAPPWGRAHTPEGGGREG